MCRVATCVYQSGENGFELLHSIVYILSTSVVRYAGRSNTSLDTLCAWSLAVAFVFATMTFGAAVSDTLASLALTEKFECL